MAGDRRASLVSTARRTTPRAMPPPALQTVSSRVQRQHTSPLRDRTNIRGYERAGCCATSRTLDSASRKHTKGHKRSESTECVRGSQDMTGVICDAYLPSGLKPPPQSYHYIPQQPATKELRFATTAIVYFAPSLTPTSSSEASSTIPARLQAPPRQRERHPSTDPTAPGSARTRDYELQLLSSRRRASSTTSQKSTAEEHRPSRTHTPQTITEERYSFSKRSLRNIGSAQPYPATHRPRLSITQAPASATSRAITTTDPIPSERMAPKPQPSIIGPYQPEPPQASQRGFSARVPVPAIHRKPIVKGEAVASTLALQARRGSLLQDNPLCPKVDGVSVNPTIFASLGAERRSAQADLMISRPMILQPQALVTQAQARIQKANLAPSTEIVPVRY